MTDIIKDFEENLNFVKDNIKLFKRELKYIGAKNAIIIYFGNDAYDILKKYNNDISSSIILGELLKKNLSDNCTF
jgi:hypothetical protein